MQLDEYAGQGGSYELDPKTGKRVLIERTKETDSAAEETAAAPEQAQE